MWMFEDDDEDDPVALLNLSKKRKRRKILDIRRPGERTEAEEEGIRASEAIDRILVRLSKCPLVSGASTTDTKTDDAKSETTSKAASITSDRAGEQSSTGVAIGLNYPVKLVASRTC